MPLMGPLADGIWLRRKTQSFRIRQQKIPKWKRKGKEDRKRNWNIQQLRGSHRSFNTHVMGISEREERGKGTKEIFEVIMMENFPKLISETNPQIQESQRTPSRINDKNEN